MEFKEMLNTISGGIDYICYESDNKEDIEEIQKAEGTLYELTNLLEANGVDDIQTLKNVFNNLEEIRTLVRDIREMIA